MTVLLFWGKIILKMSGGYRKNIRSSGRKLLKKERTNLEENTKLPQEESTKQPKKDEYHLKQITIVALAIFITFCCCILFFFIIYRYNGFTDFWKKLTQILQPVIIGLVVAYLLNPLMKWVDGKVYGILTERIKNEEKAKNLARGLAITASLLFMVGIVVLLLAAIVPSILQSIQGVVTTLPSEVKSLIAWINDFAKGDSQVADIAERVITEASNFFENWMKNTFIPQAEVYIASVTSGVILTVKFFINIVVGLIISVYVMANQEKFAGQAKKIIFAIFKPVRANVIVKTIRKSNEIFGGFISGKILDSAIIGVLAYIVLAIMKMPDTVLVAVIIGVTNIIPFFGPFIGAIPSFIIIVLQNPMQGLYFLIFVIILQQIDGNIIGPKILGNSTGLSSFWVVFAILVFGGLWGFPGMLLGVPIMAVIYYIVGNIVEYILKRRGIPADKIDYVNLNKIDKVTNQPIYNHEEKVKKSQKKLAKKPEDKA